MSETATQVKVYDYETSSEITVTIITDDQGKKTYIPQDGYVLTDVIVDREFARKREYPAELVYWRKTGSTKSLVMRVPTSKEVSITVRRMNDTESKQESRENRCLIEGKDGQFVVCNKSTCADCPKAGDLKQNYGRFVSLETLMESDAGFNPSAGDTTRDTVMTKIETEEFTQYLMRKKPAFAIEFGLALDGYAPKDIAKITNTPLQTVYMHQQKIQVLKRRFDKIRGRIIWKQS